MSQRTSNRRRAGVAAATLLAAGLTSTAEAQRRDDFFWEEVELTCSSPSYSRTVVQLSSSQYQLNVFGKSNCSLTLHWELFVAYRTEYGEALLQRAEQVGSVQADNRPLGRPSRDGEWGLSYSTGLDRLTLPARIGFTIQYSPSVISTPNPDFYTFEVSSTMSRPTSGRIDPLPIPKTQPILDDLGIANQATEAPYQSTLTLEPSYTGDADQYLAAVARGQTACSSAMGRARWQTMPASGQIRLRMTILGAAKVCLQLRAAEGGGRYLTSNQKVAGIDVYDTNHRHVLSGEAEV
ncbi:MAG: hypothetical protein R3190_17490, partial [Thermoanaerobaculia bacterium]|nr:hypothetical protein [Thermoanaerobaculia bacterium]